LIGKIIGEKMKQSITTLLHNWRASGKKYCLSKSVIANGKKTPYFSDQPAFQLATTTNKTLQQIYELRLLRIPWDDALYIMTELPFKETLNEKSDKM
jgi:hypothetical protein